MEYEGGLDKLDKKARKKVHELAKKRYKQAHDFWSDKRERQKDDLRFLAGTPDNKWQWPDYLVSARENDPDGGRPCLTINKLPQHVNQIVNDHRMNRPSIKVRPVDSGADVKVAEVLDGVVRHILACSDANTVFDTTCQSQVACGEGFFRLLTRYADYNDPMFRQEIYLEVIRNPLRVVIDPMVQHPTARDANWAFILSEVPEDDFEDEYPDQEGTDWDAADMQYWYNSAEKKIVVAEYFAFKKIKEEKVDVEGRTRQVERRQLCWYKMTGMEVLDYRELPGQWIPLIRALGNEVEVEGRVEVSGIIRNAKDAQRGYNYWSSVLVEKLALQSKAPVVGYAGQFENFEDRWSTSNVRNYAYLEVNPVTDNAGSVLPLPQRMPPPADLSAIVTSMQVAAEDLKSVTGQYDASLGQRSNETSGKAIIARQREGDTGSYHYVDNMSKAVEQCGRVIVEWVPHYMDTPQILRILGDDMKPSQVRIDPTQPRAVEQVQDPNGGLEAIYNFGTGKYDVSITVGPGFATKRQEQLTAMSEMVKGNPALWQVIGDLMVRSMDWPGAEKMADRLKLTLIPPIQQMEAENANLPPEIAAQITQAQMQMEQQQQMMAQQGEAMAQAQEQATGEMHAAEKAKLELEIMRERLKAEEQRIMMSKQIMDARTGEQMAKLDQDTQAAINTIKDLLDDHETKILDTVAPPRKEGVEKEEAPEPDVLGTVESVMTSHDAVMKQVSAMIEALVSQTEKRKQVIITTPSGDVYTGEVN